MKYTLNTTKVQTIEQAPLKKMLPLLLEEKKSFLFGMVMVICTSALNLLGPYLFGVAIDHTIQVHDIQGTMVIASFLVAIFISAAFTGWLQTKTMGSIGQRTLFRLRNALFEKIQSLPIAFFHQNKIGDLISRINNDTEKLNQFFSQSLTQFFGNAFIMIGAGIMMLFLSPILAWWTLVPALLVLLITQLIAPLVRTWNGESLKATGSLSAEVQEGLSTFKVILLFQRTDYFLKKLQEKNEETYRVSLKSGVLNQLFSPLYGFAYHVAQMVVLLYGVHLLLMGQVTIGVLMSFLALTTRFYEPMRFLAAIWTSFQTAMASWDRVAEILQKESNLKVMDRAHLQQNIEKDVLLSFEDVAFAYEDGKEILQNISFNLKKGRTYALVGPTGGGKTTTASLMARLYDATRGTIWFEGKDIRSYHTHQLSQDIGFILQDPFLFSGTVYENIIYGNEFLKDTSMEQLQHYLEEEGLESLLSRFPEGLSTKIKTNEERMSLGQKQIIAFLRAVLRKPKLLILDEATANVDTVTEQVLDDILKKLPTETTLVIIAHRLNTIANADTIFFVNGGTLTHAGSMEEALHLLLHEGKTS